MIMKKSVLFALLAVLSTTNQAANWAWDKDIVGIRAYPGGTGHYIKISDGGIWEGCTVTRDAHILYLPDSNGRVFASLLTAQATGNKVSFNVSGSDGGGSCHGGGYAKIVEIQLGDW